MVNWNRIAAIWLVAFFTVFAATTGAGIPENSVILSSFLGGVIQGGLAAAQEYKREADLQGDAPPPLSASKPLAAFTLF